MLKRSIAGLAGGLLLLLNVNSVKAEVIEDFGVLVGEEFYTHFERGLTKDVPFVHEIQFTLDRPFGVGAHADDLDITVRGHKVKEIDGFSLALFDDAGNLISQGVRDGTVIRFTEDLPAGDYYAQIMGTPTGRGAGAYVFGMVAAVPEAEVWAMMIAGMGFLGWRLRRANEKKLLEKSEGDLAAA